VPNRKNRGLDDAAEGCGESHDCRAPTRRASRLGGCGLRETFRRGMRSFVDIGTSRKSIRCPAKHAHPPPERFAAPRTPLDDKPSGWMRTIERFPRTPPQHHPSAILSVWHGFSLRGMPPTGVGRNKRNRSEVYDVQE